MATPHEVLSKLVGEQKASEILDALRAAGFQVTRDVDLYAMSRTWQADH